MIKLKKLLQEDDIKADLRIPKGRTIVLQADTDEHKRGLVVTWKDDGGYDVAYWYGTPDNIVSAELKGDGKSFGDIKNVYLGFHPELDDDKTY